MNNNNDVIADKENIDKKGARSATFPKLLAYFCLKTHRLIEFIVDCDCAGNTSVEAANAIEHSLM